MAPSRSRILYIALALLILGGLLSSQAEAFSPEHSGDCSTHCCSACHLGHSPLLQPSASFDFTPPSSIEWREPGGQPLCAGGPLLVAQSSRAPPASL
jgi:hypothetical protein